MKVRRRDLRGEDAYTLLLEVLTQLNGQAIRSLAKCVLSSPRASLLVARTRSPARSTRSPFAPEC